jgi:hypothetical protein
MASVTRRLVVGAAFACGPAITSAACLPYGPTEVTLVGVVKFRTFAGPPNYESIASGDRAERTALLELKQAICVRSKAPDLINVPRNKVKVVQLVLTPKVNVKEGQAISVTGTLFGSHTGHHRTRVLIEVRTAKDAI